MKAHLLLLAALAACHAAPPVPTCDLALSGNFAEASSTRANCPTLVAGAGATRGDTVFQLDLASRALHGHLAATIDLGPTPTPGAYNAGTTPLWTAKGLRTVAPAGACIVLAGNNASPTGTFVLAITAMDHATAHGTLDLQMAVLPRVGETGAQTDCGPGTTEHLHLRF
jgi:hypothetical protein